MKFFVVFLVTCVAAINGLPSFQWESEVSSRSGIPLLAITFPSGEVAHAVLEQYNPIPQLETERSEDVDNCIFTGYLQQDPQSSVTLAGGCPQEDSFEIMINSARYNGFLLKVENGVVRELESPYKHMSKNDMNKDNLRAPMDAIRAVPTTRASLPSTGFVAKVRIVYDQLFKGKFGADSVNTIRRVMAFVQDMFRWNSLTTTIRLNILTIEESQISVTGGAESDTLSTVSAYSTDSKYNAHMYLTFDNNNYGTTGIAWTGSVCSTPFYRSSLSEHFFTDAQTAQVVAHEFGHNLGMDHDFGENSAPRFDSLKNPCTGINSIMDYNQAYYSKWSTCSVEDFTANFNQNAKYCLASDDGTLGTIIPTTPAPTTPGDVCTVTLLEGCGGVCAQYGYKSTVNCVANIDGVDYKCNCSIYQSAAGK